MHRPGTQIGTYRASKKVRRIYIANISGCIGQTIENQVSHESLIKDILLEWVGVTTMGHFTWARRGHVRDDLCFAGDSVLPDAAPSCSEVVSVEVEYIVSTSFMVRL